MGVSQNGRAGMWEIHENILWVQEGYSTRDVFLVQSSILIHGTGGEVRILHLEGKDPREAPHGWDHDLVVPSFFLERTTGSGIGDSLM